MDINILIVHSNVDTLVSLKSRLTLPKPAEESVPLGTVSMAWSVGSARKVLDEMCVHIVFLDATLYSVGTQKPISSLELIPIVKGRYPLATIIMISNDDALNRAGIALGASRGLPQQEILAVNNPYKPFGKTFFKSL